MRTSGTSEPGGRRAARGRRVVVMAIAGMVVSGMMGSEGVTTGEQSGVTRAPFGKTADGEAVELFTLRNAKGIEVRAMTYGAIITSIRVPDRQGTFADVTLGFDTLEPYLARHPYFGAVIGRYGNRIGNARFTLNGQVYTLAANNGPNHLHGGVKGFDKYVWSAAPAANGAGVTFSRTSADGEEGYPGAVNVGVTYTLSDANALTVEYEATATKATPINLTQHSYFNLSGQAGSTILGHDVTIQADRFTPVDATLIPTGQLAPVEGTPFDFRKPTAVGARIEQSDPQLKMAGGYDHNFVLNRSGDGLQPAARVVERTTGRTLDVATTEPGLQFYTGNFLDGTVKGKGGAVYVRRSGLCLETQHFPDSPNKPSFPSTILQPGSVYHSRTVYKFGVQ